METMVGKVVSGILQNEFEFRGTVVEHFGEEGTPVGKIYTVKLHHLLFDGKTQKETILIGEREIREVHGLDSDYDEFGGFDPFPPEEIDPSWEGAV